MRHNYLQNGERIDLRPLTEEDAQKMRLLRNKNTNSFFNSCQITADAQKAWYNNYLEKTGEYMFSVYLADTTQWIGAVGIYNIDPDSRTAEFGRLLIDKDAAQLGGLGVDTTLAACRFAFDQLDVDAIYLEVYTDNIPAVRTYEKSGFSMTQETCDNNGRTIRRMAIQK